LSAKAQAIDGEGWLLGARRVQSPNFDDRPLHASIDLLVVHSISLPPGEFGGNAILELFTNTLDCSSHPAFEDLAPLRVSAHFLIRRDGETVQFVSCLKRAWHAGVSAFEGRERCNDFSVGIELEGIDSDIFTNAQYDALIGVSAALTARFPIFAVAAHSEIAPSRKTDPGPGFDWQKLLDSAPTLRRMRSPLGGAKS
jgi:AmpD protein